MSINKKKTAWLDLRTFLTILACCEVNPERLQSCRNWRENVAVVRADEFNVYTREAGAGNVSVSIEGPSKAKIEMVDRHCGYVTVGYVVAKEGNETVPFTDGPILFSIIIIVIIGYFIYEYLQLQTLSTKRKQAAKISYDRQSWLPIIIKIGK